MGVIDECICGFGLWSGTCCIASIYFDTLFVVNEK